MECACSLHCEVHCEVALIGIVKWPLLMRGLGVSHEGDASRLHRPRQENDAFLVCAVSPALRLFYRRFVGKKPRKKKHVKRQGLHTSSFTLQEIRMMPETGANQCHFVMQFTVVLAEYHCRYDWHTHTMPDIRQGVFHPTRFALPQGTLLPLTPHDSLVIYRAQARRRAPALPPTAQLLLFEVVPTG